MSMGGALHPIPNPPHQCAAVGAGHSSAFTSAMARLPSWYIFVAAATWGIALATQQPFASPTTKLLQTDTLLSASFLSFVDEIRKNGSIPGISIGVVRLGEDKQPIVQLASSGRKTEGGNGHDLTPDVCRPFI